MKYLVKMWDVGRGKATEEKVFDIEPSYESVYKMAKKYLLSSEIDFDADKSEPSGYPITNGKIIVGGWRVAGSFSIEQLATFHEMAEKSS